jgi:autotransporter-associated beta strand protein/predicted outer membrane repeat protein
VNRSTSKNPTNGRLACSGKLIAFLSILSCQNLHAETVLITTDTTIVIQAAVPAAVSGTLQYNIRDGNVLTFTGSRAAGPGGMFDVRAGNRLVIGPEGDTKSGKVVFDSILTGADGTLQLAGVLNVQGDGATASIDGAEFLNNKATSHGGAVYITQSGSLAIANSSFSYNESTQRNGGAVYMNAGWLTLDNVSFTGNTAPAEYIGGAINTNNAASYVTGRNLLFAGNHAGIVGAVRNTGSMILMDVDFNGNYSLTYGGAFHSNNTAAIATLTDASFEENRAGTLGGAIRMTSGDVILENAAFTGNWSGSQGGAIYGATGAGNDVTIILAESGGTNSYHYVGNIAGNGEAAITEDMLGGGSAPAPVAKAGGFYYSPGAGALIFDIDDGASLTIGSSTATDRAADSIASGAVTGNARLEKKGGGTLILNADNAYYSGTVAVSGGRLLLGNSDARLGGIITTASGAIFGGIGTVTTLSQGDALIATTVAALAGSTIQVGTGDAAGEKLVIDGDLVFADATLSFVAFGGTHTQLEVTGAFAATGSNTVNIQSFTTGTHNLGGIGSLLATSGTVTLTVNGAVPAAGGRQGADWVADPVDLIVDYWSDMARVMNWTGAVATGKWNNADDNWAAQSDNSITKFAAGDVVLFPGTAGGDVAAELDSTVAIAGMEIDGPGNTTFQGAGGIIASAWQGGDAESEVQSAGGKLVKRGAGTLTFANGANQFYGGIDLYEGVIRFDNAGQLRTSGNALNFLGDGALQANANNMVVGNAITIADGKTATIDTNGHALVLAGGNISGASGKLVKIGAGTLQLDSANTHGGGTELKDGAIRIGHNQALGTGALTLSDSGTAVEVNGGLSVPNNININVANAVIRHAGGAGTTLSGGINGPASMLTVGGTGPLTFSGANTLKAFVVASNASVLAGSAGAFGGDGSDVTVAAGGSLMLGLATGESTRAKSLAVNGGRVTLGNLESFTGDTPVLALADGLTLSGSAVLALGTQLQSDSYTLVKTTGMTGEEGVDFILDKGSTNEDKDMEIMIDGDGNVRLISMDQAVNPGKDIAVTYDAMIAAMNVVVSRLNESFLMPVVERKSGDLERNLWVKGVGSFGKYDATKDKVGCEDTTYGVMIGYDAMPSEDMLFGIYLGYMGSTLKTSNHAETDIDTPYGGIYGVVRQGRAYVSADVMYGAPDADSTRRETYGYANGFYKSTALSGSAEIGAVLGTWKTVAIKPSVGVNYMNIEFDDHVERGPGAMTVKGFRTDVLQAVVGLQTTQVFTSPWGRPAVFDARAGWIGNLKNSDTKITASFINKPAEKYNIVADEYGHNSLTLGAGLRLSITKHSLFNVSYDYEIGTDYARSTASASLRWVW